MDWTSKSRKQIIESDEESTQDESVTRCICGEQHSIGLMVQCDQCEVWQHCECMKLEEEDIPDQYFCEQCRLTDHVERYKPLSPESDIGRKKRLVKVSNNTDSDVSSAQETDYELRRLDRTSRTATKRIDKKQKQKRKQKRVSRTTTPQLESTNHYTALCCEESPSIKVRLPDACMTFEEMKKRANHILESIYTMQLEVRSQKTITLEEEQSAGTTYSISHLITEIPCSPSSMSSASTIPLNNEESTTNPVKKVEPSSFELMDLLTRDIINFQQRFG